MSGWQQVASPFRDACPNLAGGCVAPAGHGAPCLEVWVVGLDAGEGLVASAWGVDTRGASVPWRVEWPR